MISRQARRSVVVTNFLETRTYREFTPLLQVVIDTVPLPIPTLVIIPSRVRCKEHPTGAKTPPQFSENAEEFAGGNVKQRRVREYTVKTRLWKIQREKILVQDFYACLASCHFDESQRAIKADRLMTEVAKRNQIPTRPTAEIEDAVRTRSVQFSQQGLDILRNIVVLGA